MAKYRLLRGSHHETKWVQQGSEQVDEGTTYHKGDLIETDDDLLKYNSGDARSPKFERVLEGTEQVPDTVEALEVERSRIEQRIAELKGKPASDPLEDMTVADLRALADSEEIDLGEARTKAQIIEAIRQAHQAVSG
jgi:hypothetical protein